MKWSDGVENAERNLSVTDDFSLIAIFEKTAEGGSNGSNGSGSTGSPTDNGGSPTETKFTLSLMSNDSNMGTVSGAGQYTKDASASIKAEPKSGYLFDQWSDGNKNAERSVTVSRDMSLLATFYQEGTQRTSEREPQLPPAE